MKELESIADWYSAQERSEKHNQFPTFEAWVTNNLSNLKVSDEAKNLTKKYLYKRKAED